MSTATIAANGHAVTAANKSVMANALAKQQGDTLLVDAKSVVTWLPNKIIAGAKAVARWMRLPQFGVWLRGVGERFLGVVGKGAFAVEVLTSPWGQATIKAGFKVATTVTAFTIKAAWFIVTSPLRVFTPTRNGVHYVESKIAAANAKLTPNSGTTFGPLQLIHESLARFISHQRTHMRFARVTALAVMSIRVTRRFVPIGWVRVLCYILDGLIISRSYGEVLKGTWLGRKLAWEQAVMEAEVDQAAKNASAEVTKITRESATAKAEQMRAAAETVERSAEKLAEATAEDVRVEAAKQAAEMRTEADALEKTAERLEAAEQATSVITEPKPGPAVPPMGGRTPGQGPAPQHPRHTSGKGKGR